MKLIFTIELGNAAMETYCDAQDKFDAMQKRLSKAICAGLRDGGKVMDDNGNSVGTWEFEPD